MLSPKMQRTIRINENQVLMLAEKARHDHNYSGYLYKRSSDSNKWQLRWFTLYQNLLFYSEGESSVKPSGVIMLEGCYCERLITTNTNTKNKDTDKQFCFAITYRRENQRQYDLKAETEGECKAWIDVIRQASFNKLLLQKEELEQKHLHLLQIVESEKTAKWQYTQQCEELTSEIKKLRAELCTLKKEWRVVPSRRLEDLPEDSEEIKKIKKVQSFFRGWLCRRRWKQIVEEYIRSPHAESMRKRNSLVFRMVEAEEEYVEQLNLLVSCFLRPFKMAASSKKPPCSHEDVNSIFLNSETLLFLHQIFLKGLSARMESWPTLVLDGGRDPGSVGSSPRQKKTSFSTIQLLGNTHLGDLFDMLLPMLSIYQEYVRNHHYSLQVLAECKQNPHFGAFLNRLENKPNLQGRTLETFLTYPMHQIPRYIITLHELLAHTPHNHVERKSLDHARMQLEDLSRQMHDEVSETENIRKNLAIERMIVEGCDILLDVNQMFVRQGSLIQVLGDRPRPVKTRLGQFKSEKEAVRQCFLFSNHLIVATRTSGGKLHLVANVGKVPLNDATLIEDPTEQVTQDDDGESASVCSLSSQSSGVSDSSAATSSGSGPGKNFPLEQANLDFKIIVEQKSGTPITLHLVAPTMQEKQAWISDISQCLDNVHFNNLFRSSMSDTSSVTMPHFIKNDPKLFKDDIDIRFSRTLNSCKVPHIRYATPERLLERLTDLRFLSIDFLNTFLLTYRVFTDGVTVLEALKKVYYNPDVHDQMADSRDSSVERSPEYVASPPPDFDSGRNSPRRTSTFSPFPGLEMEAPRDRCWTFDAQVAKASGNQHWRWSYRRFEEEQREQEERRAREETDPPAGASQGGAGGAGGAGGSQEGPNLPISAPNSPFSPKKVTIRTDDDHKYLTIPKGRRVVGSTSSADTLIGDESMSQPDSPTDAATSTLTGAGPVLQGFSDWKLPFDSERVSRTRRPSKILDVITSPPRPCSGPRRSLPPRMSSLEEHRQMETVTSGSEAEDEQDPVAGMGARRRSAAPSHTPAGPSTSSPGFLLVGPRVRGAKRLSCESDTGGLASPRSSVYTATPRSSFQVPDSPSHSVPRVGVVITSSRQSQRRSSSASAAAAFAVATAGSSNPRDIPKTPPLGRFSVGGEGRRSSFRERPSRQESIISTAATMRVLNVLRHWVSKHSQDFETDLRLKTLTIEFLEDLVCCPTLLPAEHKAASQLLRLLTKEEPANPRVDLNTLLTPPTTPSKESIETLSALEVAEQMTYIDHQIFVAIRSEEFLKTAWMKDDKQQKAPYILLITRRFNEVSRLVASEIIRGATMASRIAVIEKWVAVADICRCLHNYNGVLQVCAAFQNSSVFRLKKTWEKVSKTTRQTLEKLQTLVSSDGRFRSLRDALHRCDPPCIPYLGMYLTDLSFIEEGTPNFTEDTLLNFSKMRMIAHVIREIRHFQQTPYKIEHNQRVTAYLLDPSLLLSDDNLYRMSLELEPRRSTLTHVNAPLLATATSSGSSSSSSS